MRAVFLDRDGVLTAKLGPGEHLMSAEDMVVMPHAVEAVDLLREHGFTPIIASNQRGVPRDVLRSIDYALEAHGVEVAASYYCTHEDADNCPCRKPKPGLLEFAAGDYGFNLRECVLIGDSVSDMKAAAWSGCFPILVVGPIDVLSAAQMAVAWAEL